jgi:DNA-binding ferritin-like protein
MSGPSQFFSKLFESREMAHVYHLSVKGDMGSYAAHVALGAYYDAILEFIDDLIEIYQGQYGLVENFDIIDTSSTKTQEPIDYFEDLVMFVKSTRNTSLSAEDTHLQNIIDEIIALIYKTLYKLKYNK